MKSSSFCEVCSDSFVESSVSPVTCSFFLPQLCQKYWFIQVCDSFVTNSVSQVSSDGFVTVLGQQYQFQSGQW